MSDRLDETHSCGDCDSSDIWIDAFPCSKCIHNPNHICHFKKKGTELEEEDEEP